ncbi:MAG: hypothetical protein IJT98_11145 [Prevotella sp.]|nr:hypothetical protein [Prevotella sp.]
MNNKIFKGLYLALATTAMIGFTACEDEPDKYEISEGSPTIRYIRPVNVEAADSIITGAYMDNNICIVGENLRSITKMFFNDQEAKLIPSLITDNTMIVTVPGQIPGEVFNKIFMVNNSNDTTTYDFSVLVPGPNINNMSNEWAKAGETATIYGNYFVDDPNVPLSLSINGRKIDIDEFTISTITFTVPEGLAEGPIEISTVYGKKKAKFNYHDTNGMLFNDWGTYDAGDKSTGLTNHGWHNQLIVSDENSLDGSYLFLGDCDVDNDTWADGNLAFEYWPGDWDGTFTGTNARLSDLVSFTDFANMALKFEVNIPSSNPWTNLSMQCIFSGDEQVTLLTANNSFFNGTDYPRGLWTPWNATGSYDTGGKWVTVTLPFSTFKYKHDGTPASVPLTASNFTGLTLFVWKGVTSGTTCHPIIRIDNVRAVAY